MYPVIRVGPRNRILPLNRGRIFLLHRKFLQISYAIKSPTSRMHTRAYGILSALPTTLGARVSQEKLFLVAKLYLLKFERMFNMIEGIKE